MEVYVLDALEPLRRVRWMGMLGPGKKEGGNEGFKRENCSEDRQQLVMIDDHNSANMSPSICLRQALWKVSSCAPYAPVRANDSLHRK